METVALPVRATGLKSLFLDFLMKCVLAAEIAELFHFNLIRMLFLVLGLVVIYPTTNAALNLNMFTHFISKKDSWLSFQAPDRS